MAPARTFQRGRSLQPRGQGAVEAILALPVFLILICLLSQLFLVAMARIQLQYAAFYAARVGAVRSGDEDEMKRAALRVLSPWTGNLASPGSLLDVEILEIPEKGNDTVISPARNNTDEPLMVRLHWDFPLIVPLADRLLTRNRILPVSSKSTLHLQASWTMPLFRIREKEIEGDTSSKP